MWTGRIDSEKKERFHQCIKIASVDEIPDDASMKVAFVGFASDEGIKRNQGRPGASEGPAAIRKALGSLPFYNRSLTLYETGDIFCEGDALEEAQALLAQRVSALLQKNVLPIVLGGGHEVAWGHFQGLMQAHPTEEIAIINFDAHLDMRPYGDQGSSGTPFLQIKDALNKKNIPFNYTCIGLQDSGSTQSMMETSIESRVTRISAGEIHLNGMACALPWLEHIASSDSPLYVTICLDVFASAYAPGVSAPQPLGLSPWQMIPLLRFLALSGKVISLDIAELSPSHDTDGITAKLAAELIFDYLHHLMKG